MKKYLIMFLLAFMPATAHAERWAAVGDFNDGQRLIVDSDTLTFENDDGLILISGNFKFFGHDDTLVSASIDQKYCKEGNGPLMLSSNIKNKKLNTTLFFSSEGKKDYDYMGLALCDYYNTQQDEPLPQTNPEQITWTKIGLYGSVFISLNEQSLHRDDKEAFGQFTLTNLDMNIHDVYDIEVNMQSCQTGGSVIVKDNLNRQIKENFDITGSKTFDIVGANLCYWAKYSKIMPKVVDGSPAAGHYN